MRLLPGVGGKVHLLYYDQLQKCAACCVAVLITADCDA